MIPLKYSLVIEATADPQFFGFFSPDISGFTGAGRSIEDCIQRALAGMDDHVQLLREQRLPVPPENPNPRIVIQNQQTLAPAAGF
ncbi:MAG: type II toxin-antitoxin system HicB family antitoxin [Acidobacteriota bacterium]